MVAQGGGGGGAVAETVRFELTNGSPRRQFSRLLPSTARPRLPEGRILPERECARARARGAQACGGTRRLTATSSATPPRLISSQVEGSGIAEICA